MFHFEDLAAHHCCYPDLGDGGIDPAGQDSDPGFGVDCCYGSEKIDSSSRCLTLIVVILTLDIVSGICLQGIIAFAPGVQTAVSPNASSVDWALFLSIRIFLLCLTGLFGPRYHFT